MYSNCYSKAPRHSAEYAYRLLHHYPRSRNSNTHGVSITILLQHLCCRHSNVSNSFVLHVLFFPGTTIQNIFSVEPESPISSSRFVKARGRVGAVKIEEHCAIFLLLSLNF